MQGVDELRKGFYEGKKEGCSRDERSLMGAGALQRVKW